jgi:hypothetical protein
MPVRLLYPRGPRTLVRIANALHTPLYLLSTHRPRHNDFREREVAPDCRRVRFRQLRTP